MTKFLTKVNPDAAQAYIDKDSLLWQALEPRREEFESDEDFELAVSKFGMALREVDRIKRDVRMALQKLVGRSNKRGLMIPNVRRVVLALIQDVLSEIDITKKSRSEESAKQQLRDLFKSA